MKVRLANISYQRRELNAAERVCRQMQIEGAVFQSLDADRYMRSFDMAMTLPPDIKPTVPESDKIEPVRCPWRRFFARSFDRALIICLVNCFLALVFRVNVTNIPLIVDWVLGLACWGVSVLVNSLFLSKFGTTPGKWIFGIRLEHSYGRRLTFGEAASRESQVFTKGDGLTIPIYSSYRNYKSYKAAKNGEELPWDEDVVITVNDNKWWRGFAYAGIFLLVVVITLAAEVYPARPRHRGPELTVEEFSENYNQMLRVNGFDGLKLKPDGTFVDPNGDGMCQSVNDNPININYTVSDGVVTKVSLAKRTTMQYYSLYNEEWRNAVLASTMAYSYANTSALNAVIANGNLLDRIIEEILNENKSVCEFDLFGVRMCYSETKTEDVELKSGDPIYMAEISLEYIGK